MEFVVNKDDMRVPIKVWTDIVEHGAMEQAINLSKHPSLFRHVALMPDTHQGYGMPIGGVIATEHDVIPNAVGVDIGCGVAACKLDLSIDDLSEDTIKEWMGQVREEIPVGFKHRKDPHYTTVREFQRVVADPIPIGLKPVADNIDSGLCQLGTLGGGNHFIELQKDLDEAVWIMIHSGSRNIGLQIAKYYHKIAVDMMEQWKVPVQKDLSFLPVKSDYGYEYLTAMHFALDFAKVNRQLMINKAAAILQHMVSCDILENQNVHHNYARIEHHFGRDVWVHRKGATNASEKAICLIPGSQGTASYIGYGLGNKESFNSCSHGAGRLMGRKRAKEVLDLEDEKMKMEGIFHSVRSRDDLDESVGAYKDIDKVMEFQEDLVTAVNVLLPVAVIKG